MNPWEINVNNPICLSFVSVICLMIEIICILTSSGAFPSSQMFFFVNLCCLLMDLCTNASLRPVFYSNHEKQIWWLGLGYNMQSSSVKQDRTRSFCCHSFVTVRSGITAQNKLREALAVYQHVMKRSLSGLELRSLWMSNSFC